MKSLTDGIQVGMPTILGRFSVIPLLRLTDVPYYDHVTKFNLRGDGAGRDYAFHLAYHLERAPNQVGAIYLHGADDLGFDLYAARRTHAEQFRCDFEIFAGQYIDKDTPIAHLRDERANPFCARSLSDYLPDDGRTNPTDLRDALAGYHSDVLSQAQDTWQRVLAALHTPALYRIGYIVCFPYHCFGVSISPRVLVPALQAG